MYLLKFAVILIIAYFIYAYFRARGREGYIRTFDLPQGLYRRLTKHHPNLTTAEFQLVCDSLRQFFLVHLRSGRKLVSMPSQVTDDLWHEFILYTQAYQTFCKKGFGKFLHHTPAAALTPKQKKSNAGLQRTWYFACQIEKINTNKPTILPLIFGIDALLNITNGFHYVTDCKKAGLVTENGATAIYCGGDFASSSSSCSSSGCTTSSCSGGGDSSGCSGGCGGGCGGGGD
ncbi:MAG: hypothetical protein NVS3B3_00780 [Aquirhabdus sp.]